MTKNEIIDHVENAIASYGDQLDCVYSYFIDNAIPAPSEHLFREFIENAGIPVYDLYSVSDNLEQHTYDLCLFVTHF